MLKRARDTHASFRIAELRRHAARLRAHHPRAGDYLEQAPVLAPATLGLDDGDLRRFFRDHCKRGARLRAMMTAFGLAYPLRKLPASAFRVETGRISFLRHFADVHPSSIAQSIERHAGAEREWLDAMWEWWFVCSRRGCFLTKAFAWGVRAVEAPLNLDPAHMIDFIDRPSSLFDPRWSMAAFTSALTRWESTYTEHDRLVDCLKREGVDPEQVFDYGPLPASVFIDGLELRALATPLDIVNEGAAMRHCAASYITHVAHGRSWLYSVRRDGERLATLELVMNDGRFVLAQIKARRNGPAPAEALHAARRFVRQIAPAAAYAAGSSFGVELGSAAA
ncbi:MAG: PcfJ domain-containing protein [Maricaulaceae bacterium]